MGLSEPKCLIVAFALARDTKCQVDCVMSTEQLMITEWPRLLCVRVCEEHDSDLKYNRNKENKANYTRNGEHRGCYTSGG